MSYEAHGSLVYLYYQIYRSLKIQNLMALAGVIRKDPQMPDKETLLVYPKIDMLERINYVG